MDAQALDASFAAEEEDALSQMIDRYGQPLLRYCHHILCDYHEAQDAVQITFYKAYTHRARVQPGTNLSAWLYRLAQKHRPARPYFRAALAAACLAVMLGVTVGAAGLSDAWRYFFPGVPENAVTELGVSQTNGDCTLTLEQAIADDSGVLLLLGLSRTDGGEIDPEIRTYFGDMALDCTLSLDGMPVLTSTGGYRTSGRTLSGDGKTLYFTKDLQINDVDGSLEGRTLTLQVPALGKWYTNFPATVSLASLAEEEIPTYRPVPGTEREAELGRLLAEQNCDLPIPEAEGFSGAAVRGAIILEDGALSIAMESIYEIRGMTDCIAVEPNALVDTRTGTRYDMDHATTAYLPDGTKTSIVSFRDCPLTAADLPWLELEVEYQIAQLVCKEPFTLDFQVDTSSALTLFLEPIQFDGQTLLLRELRLSAREIALELEQSEAYDASLRVPLTITLKDGTVLEPWVRGGHLNEVCVLNYTLLTEDGVPWFLDTSQVASVTIGDTTFAVP